MSDRDRLILEQVAADLERLRMQAEALGQDQLAYLIDMAVSEARNALKIGEEPLSIESFLLGEEVDEGRR